MSGGPDERGPQSGPREGGPAQGGAPETGASASPEGAPSDAATGGAAGAGPPLAGGAASGEAPPELGWSAGLVRVFLESQLSILFLLASLIVGAVALIATPREEDPQIVVPVIDVAVEMPGASAEEVERLAASPLESILAEIPGVENVYSMSSPGGALVTARFYVGEDRERSLTKVFTALESNRHRVPPGVPGWQVRPVDIDDVPIVTAALFSRQLDETALREVANEVLRDLQRVPEVGKSWVVGGRRREVRVAIDPARLAGLGLTSLDVVRALQRANANLPAGEILSAGLEVPVRAGPFLRSADEVAEVVVGVARGPSDEPRPVRARDVGEVVERPEEPATYTRFAFGSGARHSGEIPPGYAAGEEVPSVTIALAKRRGANAVAVARAVEQRLEELRGRLIPDGVEVRVTRDYGETANHKVNELVKHLVIAVVTIVVLLGLSLGWREAAVVALAVPTTLAVTLAADLLFGYSINRVTLFALILSLGLLVDDPIVDVENIYRHFKLRRHPPLLATLVAVDEIRPPTILATLTVIVAFLPMFFITGMMGPYMGPMAFNVPVAMLTSLIVAFTVTPWAAYHALRREYDRPAEPFDLHATTTYRLYSRVVQPLLRDRRLARRFLTGIAIAFVAAVALVPAGLVPVKMLPFDNKNELLLVVDMPEGTPLERTDGVLTALGAVLAREPEVRDWQTVAGAATPIDFNGLVRHTFLRRGGHLGDVRVNLLPKDDRAWQSHAIALRLRPELERVAREHGADLKIVETPPGPPVIATLVAEVRGPIGASPEEITTVAEGVREAFRATPGVSDVDWMMEAPRERYDVEIDAAKAALHGIDVASAAATVRAALAGGDAGALREAFLREPIPIRVRLPEALRADPSSLLALRVRGADGALVPLGELARVARRPEDRTIYHKDSRPLVYVTGEPVGISPVDALWSADARARHALPAGWEISWRGEGEWKITTEVFRDLGLAFGAALVGIYVLLVAQTGSLSIPLVIMLAIPLTLIGVFPGFFLLNLVFGSEIAGAPNPIFFTAPGMIGLIALAGIVVRNSIILIDFAAVLRAGGMDLERAVIEAGATRLRPILLTASAALLGAWVIVLDPIFSGLAWAFIFGIFASTAFTLVVVPTVYFMVNARSAGRDTR